jgi:16S rRNA (adenine1518-N6/adenine1519-N6)-dimethyltransferase
MIRAKKKFGQNFLKDEHIVYKIIEAIPKNDKDIVEIGPGLGDLTNKLVKYKDVTAYEVDEELYDILHSKFKSQIEQGRLKIILGDVLQSWDKNLTLHNGKYDLIANLPYYIATNIILRAIDDINCCSILVMVQKEVAKKFSASNGDKEFSSLGVISKLVSRETKILFDVPPESFEPQPKVVSSILFIDKKEKFLLKDEFKKFLRIAFSQPRKTLIKNLSANFNKSRLVDIFVELDLKTNIRPHELSASLYNLLYERVNNNGRKEE